MSVERKSNQEAKEQAKKRIHGKMFLCSQDGV
jgi:hypothetical protein